MGSSSSQRANVRIVAIPSLWRMEQDWVVGQQEVDLGSDGLFDHGLGGIDREHQPFDCLVAAPQLAANRIPRLREMEGDEFFESLFHFGQSHGSIEDNSEGSSNEARRGERINLFGRPETDPRVPVD